MMPSRLLANRKLESVQIEEVVHKLLENAGIDVNIDGYVKTLKDNLILNCQVLSKIPDEVFPRLGLPLFLETALLQFKSTIIQSSILFSNIDDFIQSNEIYYENTGLDSSKSQSDGLVKIVRSNSSNKPLGTSSAENGEDTIFGLDEHQQELIKRSWHLLSDPKSVDLIRLFDTFFDYWFAIDNRIRQLFQNCSLTQRARILLHSLRYIVGAIDKKITPAIVHKIAITQVTYGITGNNFVTFTDVLLKTMDELLGPDNCTKETKHAWLTLIRNLADVILKEFEVIYRGWNAFLYVFRRNQWKLRYTTLNHKKIIFYRDSERTKQSSYITLEEIQDVQAFDADGRLPDIPNENCFSLKLDEETCYFCSSSGTELKSWIDEISMRLLAYRRYRLLEGDMDENSSSQGDETVRSTIFRRIDRIRRKISTSHKAASINGQTST